MSLQEVLPALQQGTIDGVNSVLGVFVAFRYHDAAQNLLDTALWPIISLALVSKIFYDRLPPDLQKTVLETGQKIEPELANGRSSASPSDTKAWAEKGGKTSSFRRTSSRKRCGACPPSAQAVVGQERSAEGALRPAQNRQPDP